MPLKAWLATEAGRTPVCARSTSLKSQGRWWMTTTRVGCVTLLPTLARRCALSFTPLAVSHGLVLVVCRVLVAPARSPNANNARSAANAAQHLFAPTP